MPAAKRSGSSPELEINGSEDNIWIQPMSTGMGC